MCIYVCMYQQVSGANESSDEDNQEEAEQEEDEEEVYSIVSTLCVVGEGVKRRLVRSSSIIIIFPCECFFVVDGMY